MRTSFLAPFGLLLASSAFSQVTLFEDDFSSSLGHWDVSGPWYIAPSTDNCLQQTSPAAGQGSVARMGDPGASCGFTSVGGGSASIRTSTPITIPAHAAEPTLSFRSFVDTELCNGWDYHFVYVVEVQTNTYHEVFQDCSMLQVWHDTEVDLSPWSGQDIQIVFAFDAIDPLINEGLGWFIDNVKVGTAACTSENYCVAAPNSVSATGARLGFVGSKRIHANDFTLTMEDAPPGQFAHFFFGPFQNQFPVASGFLCVSADSFGIRRLYPGGQIDANGNMTWPVDFSALTGHLMILPGTTMNFQCWYRDNVGGMSTSNFSDGYSVTFCE